jgi:CD2 antigen cytoplasmic tail-binding protein 2
LYFILPGQEDLEDGFEFDGDTKITPFNMKDEMEEGYFDGHGMYIWNKRDGSEVKDSWLDSVDWMKVVLVIRITPGFIYQFLTNL